MNTVSLNKIELKRILNLLEKDETVVVIKTDMTNGIGQQVTVKVNETIYDVTDYDSW